MVCLGPSPLPFIGYGLPSNLAAHIELGAFRVIPSAPLGATSSHDAPASAWVPCHLPTIPGPPEMRFEVEVVMMSLPSACGIIAMLESASPFPSGLKVYVKPDSSNRMSPEGNFSMVTN